MTPDSSSGFSAYDPDAETSGGTVLPDETGPVVESSQRDRVFVEPAPTDPPSDVPQTQRSPDRSANEAPAVEPAPALPSDAPPMRTRAGMAWVAMAVGVLLVLCLVIFVAQNTEKFHISFLWMDTSVSFGVAVLLAAVVGSGIAIVVGTARILQLRKALKKQAQP